MIIKVYEPQDEANLFSLMEAEGEEWSDYYGEKNRDKYRKAFKNSIVYVAYEGDTLWGYCRCRDDDGYGIYIYDLLVDKKYRGRKLGKMLMDRVCHDYPNDSVYVMSDVDAYYEKQGYCREGSIFQVYPNN